MMNFETAASPLPNETDTQFRIFMQFATSRTRNLSEIARDNQIAKSTIFRWRRDLDWDARVEVIDAVVQGYVYDKDFETEVKDAISDVNAAAREILSFFRETLQSDRESLTISDVSKAARGLHQTMQIFAITSWYGPVVEALKNLHKTEKAMEASEAFVKAQLPKPSQRTRDPDDEP